MCNHGACYLKILTIRSNLTENVPTIRTLLSKRVYSGAKKLVDKGISIFAIQSKSLQTIFYSHMHKKI